MLSNFQNRLKSHWLLIVILLSAFLIRIINLNYNSPFLDEAIYINLGKEFWKGHWSELFGDISWVGGFPFFYPPVSAIFHAAGGIVATRFFNVILGVGSVFLIYRFTREIFPVSSEKESKNAGFVASALMATSTIPIVFSRLATYDALLVFLFLAGVVALARAVFEGEKNAYVAGAVFLFLAFLAKYIAAIYIPLLLLITLYLALKTNRSEAVGGILKSFWVPLILLAIIYIALTFSELKGFLSSKTSEDHDSAITIVRLFVKYSPVVFLAAIPSFYLMIKKRAGILAAILAFGAILPLLVHLMTGESQSVHQHSVFALIFLLPIIGAASAIVIEKYKTAGMVLAAFIIILNFIISTPQVNALSSFWPNTEKAGLFLKAKAGPTDKILAESEDPITLALSGKLPADNIEGPFDFTYQNFEGGLAYALATKDGYFNYIETDGTFFEKDIIASIEEAVGKKYSLVFDDGSIKIWQRKL